MLDDIFNPHHAVQRVENWWEQRKQYRLANLLSLRRREGLPEPVDADGNPLETRMDDEGRVTYHAADGSEVSRVLFAGAGRDGKPGSFAQGTRKGEALKQADLHWSRADAEFEILEVAEDGRRLTEELLDLNRDAGTYEIAEQVSHGEAGEQAPDLVLDGTGDAEVEKRLQEYLRRGKR
jgi:hypothetical protein